MRCLLYDHRPEYSIARKNTTDGAQIAKSSPFLNGVPTAPASRTMPTNRGRNGAKSISDENAGSGTQKQAIAAPSNAIAAKSRQS